MDKHNCIKNKRKLHDEIQKCKDNPLYFITTYVRFFHNGKIIDMRQYLNTLNRMANLIQKTK